MTDRSRDASETWRERSDYHRTRKGGSYRRDYRDNHKKEKEKDSLVKEGIIMKSDELLAAMAPRKTLQRR